MEEFPELRTVVDRGLDNPTNVDLNSPEGSVLLGAISYGKPSAEVSDQGNDPEKNPVSYQITYQVPPTKVDEDKGKTSTSKTSKKSVLERLEEEVPDSATLR